MGQQPKKTFQQIAIEYFILMPIAVAVVEDHNLVREGLIAVLSEASSVKVVGEARDGKSALKLVEKCSPDVLLLDLILPCLHGLEVIRKVHQTTKVIGLSMRADDAFVAEAIYSGASGYVVKEACFTELIEAITTVHKGERYLSPLLNQTAINRLLQQWKASVRTPEETLTAREHTVLQLSADGMTSSQIGNELHISPRTVEMHRGNLMRKLGLGTQTDLVRFAIRKHIISA